MKVHKVEIRFSTDTWLTVSIDSGAWVLSDDTEAVRVDLGLQGMMSLSKTLVAIGHIGPVPEGAETRATLLVETDSDVLTGTGDTGGRFSLSADGGRVEFDSSGSSGPFSLRLTKPDPAS